MTTLQGWPTSAALCAMPEFKQLMASLAFDDQATTADLAIGAVITEWQRRTGYYPFLVQRDGSGNDVDTTRRFDPPGPEQGPVGIYVGLANMGGSRKLFLQGGIVSVTSLTTGVSATNTGTVLQSGVDWWPKPLNAPDLGKPYTYIEFRATQYGEPQSIVIVGKWGYTNAIDGAVYRAILRGAVAEAADPGILARFGGLQAWTEDGTEETYGANPNGAILLRCMQTFEDAAKRYRKLTVA